MKEITGTFLSFDNAALFYRRWEDEETPWNGRILLILHRGHEHSGRLEQIASQPCFTGYKIFSYDNRGHGHTEVGVAYAFMDLVRDLDAFVSFVCEIERVTPQDIFIVANSVAGVTASTWVHDYAPYIRGMALLAPAFKIKLYFPFAKQLLDVAIKCKPKLNIKSYVKSKFLTHNVEEQEKYNRDALITPNIPARQLTTLLDTARRVVDDAHLISVPTLVVSAGRDYVVERSIQGDFYANLSTETKRFVKFDNFYHGVLYEEGSEEVIDEISDFMELCFQPNHQKSITPHVSFTQKEHDKIAYGSLPWYKRVNYTLQRFMMHYFGRLSRGIEIGMKYGFDSGVTLDHVYHNKPEGVMWFGRIVDKWYLESIGWRGIRQRKAHMIMALEERIEALLHEGQKVSILDIAGGPARYLIEIAKKYPQAEIEVRDYQEQNIVEGEAQARKEHLVNITYRQCDAFDASSYDECTSFTIVIISGIFELFSDNSLVEKAIGGVKSVIAEGGTLLYTGQPWHPQLEQIAHVLGDHRGSRWVMRRRSQYELDTLFEKYGFKKEQMRVDDWGIFTVSSARMDKKQ